MSYDTVADPLDQQDRMAVDVATYCGISLYHARGLVGAAQAHSVTPLALIALIAGVNDERMWRHAPMQARVQEVYRRLATPAKAAGKEPTT